MSREIELLDRVINQTNFFECLITEDTADWALAFELGQYLTQVNPNGITGHFVLARACRHLNDKARAQTELQTCLSLIAHVSVVERDCLLPEIEKEQRFFS